MNKQLELATVRSTVAVPGDQCIMGMSINDKKTATTNNSTTIHTYKPKPAKS